MAINDKELNGYWLDQLDMIERIKRAMEMGEEQLKDQLELEERHIKRKLYQEPPLTSE